MARIERFEDLVAWQKARVLTRMIYEASRKGEFARDFGLSGQIQRAAVSIMSNVAEGFERGGGKFGDLMGRAEEVGRIIGGLRASVAKQRANNR